MSTRPIVTRTVGAGAAGAVGTAARGASAGVEAVGVEGKGSAVGVMAGAKIEDDAGVAGVSDGLEAEAGEISRTRSVRRSMSRVLVVVGGRAKGSRGEIETDGDACDAELVGEAATSGAIVGTGERVALGELEEVRAGASGALDESDETGKTGWLEKSGEFAGAGAVLRVGWVEDDEAEKTGAEVSGRSSVKRPGATLDSKREARRGWTVALVGARERWMRWRRKFMRPPFRGRAGGGPD